MFDTFFFELIENCSPCGNYLQYGETLLLIKKKDDNTVKVKELISRNIFSANKFCKFFCKLADKHEMTIVGIAKPFLIGPSVTKNNTFAEGMNLERLLKWYKIYGFDCYIEDEKYHVIRRHQ